ncbi:hypothetical protein FHR75_004452 [Kineococcus radiotolerans]|uniref:Uncharacterized protein n=1 Tax=Kineococcus radiotolerans TaxID=131568 RepID=A0A7W4TR97_KINRA|nr:hypothetical protein [Kineococcus radiotolerans]
MLVGLGMEGIDMLKLSTNLEEGDISRTTALSRRFGPRMISEVKWFY